MAEGMASIVISEHTQVMLLGIETYAQFTPKPRQPLAELGDERIAALAIDRSHAPQVAVELTAAQEVGEGQLIDHR